MAHTDWREQQESARIEADGHAFDLAYAESGEGEPATLFLHGIPTWSFLFHEVHDAADHAIVPDMPGYGYTEHLGEGGHDRSIRTMAAAADALLEELGHETVNVVAHDLGGGAALRLAVYTDRVEQLVLSNAVCYDSWPVEFIHDLGDPAAARDWSRKDIAGKLDFAFGSGVYGDETEYQTFIEGMKAPFLDEAHDIARLSRNAVATNTNHTTELTPRLGEIDVPTLLLWGGDDVLQDTQWADRLAEDLPNAEREYLDEAYHWVMADRPEAYRDALVSFL